MDPKFFRILPKTQSSIPCGSIRCFQRLTTFHQHQANCTKLKTFVPSVSILLTLNRRPMLFIRHFDDTLALSLRLIFCGGRKNWYKCCFQCLFINCCIKKACKNTPEEKKTFRILPKAQSSTPCGSIWFLQRQHLTNHQNLLTFVSDDYCIST